MFRFQIDQREQMRLKGLYNVVSSLEPMDSRVVVSHAPDGANTQGDLHLHQHDMLEFRFLFARSQQREMTPPLQELRITPPYVMHPLIPSSKLPLHSTLRFNSSLIYYLRGRDFAFTAAPDLAQFELYGISIPAMLNASMAFCSGKWSDWSHFRHLLQLFFSALYQILPDVPQAAQVHPAKYIAMYIEGHYARQDLSIAEIAQVTHFSPNYIQKIFRTVYGCSPVEYLIRTRLEKARELLRMHCYRVKEVAYLCGWNYVHYFDRRYKEAFGHLPSKE